MLDGKSPSEKAAIDLLNLITDDTMAPGLLNQRLEEMLDSDAAVLSLNQTFENSYKLLAQFFPYNKEEVNYEIVESIDKKYKFIIYMILSLVKYRHQEMLYKENLN